MTIWEYITKNKMVPENIQDNLRAKMCLENMDMQYEKEEFIHVTLFNLYDVKSLDTCYIRFIKNLHKLFIKNKVNISSKKYEQIVFKKLLKDIFEKRDIFFIVLSDAKIAYACQILLDSIKQQYIQHYYRWNTALMYTISLSEKEILTLTIRNYLETNNKDCLKLMKMYKEKWQNESSSFWGEYIKNCSSNPVNMNDLPNQLFHFDSITYSAYNINDKKISKDIKSIFDDIDDTEAERILETIKNAKFWHSSLWDNLTISIWK